MRFRDRQGFDAALTSQSKLLPQSPPTSEYLAAKLTSAMLPANGGFSHEKQIQQKLIFLLRNFEYNPVFYYLNSV